MILPFRFSTFWQNCILGVAGATAILLALSRLFGAEEGVAVTRTTVGTTPVAVFAPKSGGPAPVVVIAHGFAGSQQLMLPFALTLARNHYVAVTFDFPGHGRNPVPLAGSITETSGATATLVGELGRVVDFARTLRQGDGQVALLGHSMATDILVRYAQDHPDIAATVAVSLFSPAVTAASPRNLLIIDGDLEFSMLKDEGLRVVAMASAGAPALPGTTYGSFADGTARRVAFSPGVEHVSVLYSRASMMEALDWLNGAFGRPAVDRDVFVDAPGPWLGLLFAGLTVLAWPLSALLPRVAARPLGASLSWRQLLPVAVAPAVLTPLILWKIPTDFLPILVADYLALHFALYGVLTGAGLWFVRHGAKPAPTTVIAVPAFLASTAAVALYSTGVFGAAIDRFVTSFVPTSGRVVLILAMLCGTLPYFLADEWATRGAAARRGGYSLTKLCFLLSLAAAVALNLSKLFFLIIIVPVVLVFFAIYGLFSGWVYDRTRHPLVAAIANAIALASAIAVTFPILGR